MDGWMDGWASRALSPGAHQPLGASLVGFFRTWRGGHRRRPLMRIRRTGAKGEVLRRSGALENFRFSYYVIILLWYQHALIFLWRAQRTRIIFVRALAKKKKEGTLMAFLKVLSRQRLHHQCSMYSCHVVGGSRVDCSGSNKERTLVQSRSSLASQIGILRARFNHRW